VTLRRLDLAEEIYHIREPQKGIAPIAVELGKEALPTLSR
jgi:hypothetical protein